MNEVYVIAGGEWLRNNLNAIAAFMGTRTWDSIEKIALTLSVLAVAVMWVQRHNVMDLLGWVAVFVLIFPIWVLPPAAPMKRMPFSPPVSFWAA